MFYSMNVHPLRATSAENAPTPRHSVAEVLAVALLVFVVVAIHALVTG
jgi:hypothetical protein